MQSVQGSQVSDVGCNSRSESEATNAKAAVAFTIDMPGLRRVQYLMMFLGSCSLFALLDGIVRRRLFPSRIFLHCKDHPAMTSHPSHDSSPSQVPASSIHASQKAAIPHLTLGPDPTAQALTDTV